MKTKIIYISGNEIFDMADIRAAFDEVRTALNLGGDTVLFGVPVDTDDAGFGAINIPAASTTTAMADIPTEIEPADTAVSEITPTEIPQNSSEQPIIEKPKRTPRRTRARMTETATDDAAMATADEAATSIPADDVATAPAVTDNTIDMSDVEIQATADDITPAPVIDETPAADDDVTDTTPDATPVIPILSVLAGGAQSGAMAAPTAATEPDAGTIDTTAAAATNDDDSTDDAEINDEPIADDDINADMPTPHTTQIESETIVTITEKVTIEDMLTDEAPAPAVEKTLEQLLEKMTPLREDHVDTMDAAPIPEYEPTAADEPVAEPDVPQISDTDATLAQLASEFAENEDKIVPMPRAENHGKIGKLKNILPFKKAKRDDAGLMGDLFGWAGIAANDDEFSIPGFFTNAASKK